MGIGVLGFKVSATQYTVPRVSSSQVDTLLPIKLYVV